jgi:hypothetical protein
MPAHVLLSLMLASPPAPAPVETVRTYDLGKMTFRQAEALSGQEVRVSFKVDRLAYQTARGELVLGPCTMRGARARFPRGQWSENIDLRQRLTVEGLLRTRVLPGRRIDGQWFEQVIEVEVVGARLVTRP